MHRRETVLSLLVVLGLVACSSAGSGAGATGESAGSATQVPAQPVAHPDAPATPAIAEPGGDTARIARLEREARALARTGGCTSAAACRTAPVGARACGGPRSYIVYCAATTDTVALFRTLRELEAAEKAYNERAGMMSTCEFRAPPGVALVGGSCREAPATGVGAERVP